MLHGFGRFVAVVFALGALATLSLAAPAAVAQPRAAETVQRAREHFQAGKRAYEEQAYQRALDEFEAGYALEPRPGFLLNMGHAARKMGKLRRARALYKQFLATDPPPEDRRAAEALVRDIDGELAPEAGALSSDAAPPSAAGAPGADLTAGRGPDDAGAPAPRFYTRWWFWSAVGAAVATGVVVGLAAGRGAGGGAHDSGTWGQLNL